MNLWVYAFRSDSPLHEIARKEIENGSRSGDAYLFCPWVVGNDEPDALLAAVAIRHDATLVTADRGFGRYEGLSCRYLEA